MYLEKSMKFLRLKVKVLRWDSQRIRSSEWCTRGINISTNDQELSFWSASLGWDCQFPGTPDICHSTYPQPNGKSCSAWNACSTYNFPPFNCLGWLRFPGITRPSRATRAASVDQPWENGEDTGSTEFRHGFSRSKCESLNVQERRRKNTRSVQSRVKNSFRTRCLTGQEKNQVMSFLRNSFPRQKSILYYIL